MRYQEWFDTHADKHRRIVLKLLKQGFCAEEIVAYFDFANMCDREPEFCPLYETRTPCHDMERLNCYLCACPSFRFDDDPAADADGLRRYSRCAAASKDGAVFRHGDALHQDCSHCTLPHKEAYIRNCFDTDWRAVMRDCPLTKG